MQFLKQGTVATLKLGPFLDDTDGKTPETGLTITQSDVRLSLNGGDFAQKNDTNSATHDENGYYDVPINVTDTVNKGRLVVAISKSGVLPVWETYMIINQDVWESWFGETPLQVDLVGIGGSAQSAQDFKDLVDSGYDPSTHKIEACKANDDMRGTDSAALASVCTETRLNKLDVTVSSRAPESGGNVAAIKERTDNLPDDPADDSDIDAQLAAIAGYIDTEVAAIKERTDNLPDDPAPANEYDTEMAHLDADVSSRSSHSAAAAGTDAASKILDTPANKLVTDGSGRVSVGDIATDVVDADALKADAVDKILDEVVEGSITLRQALRLFLSVLTGKSSGGGTTTLTFRDIGDSKDRLQVTVDANGNRTAVGTRDGT